jgi:hypothetical protein
MNPTKTPTRIYLVRNTDTGDERLVRAPNVARALAHIVRVSYTCEVATQEQLVALLTTADPTEVEDALARDDEPTADGSAQPGPAPALWPAPQQGPLS